MSHYKINERKCSTTFFPFDFIFLFHTAGGDGGGSRGTLEASQENSRHHSQPRVELCLPPWRRDHRLPQSSLAPRPARRSLAQWSAPRGSQDWGIPRIPRIPRIATPSPLARVAPVGAAGQRWQRGWVPGHAATSGLPGWLLSRAGSPSFLGQVRLSLLLLLAEPCRGRQLPFSRGAWPCPGGPWLFHPNPSAGAPLPRDFLCLLPLLRVPELSLCLLWPLGLCSLPADLLYIPKIM